MPTDLCLREQIAGTLTPTLCCVSLSKHTLLLHASPAHASPGNHPLFPPIPRELPRELKHQLHSGDSHWSPNVHHHQQVGLNSQARTKARGCCQRPMYVCVCECVCVRARVCVNSLVFYIIIIIRGV